MNGELRYFFLASIRSNHLFDILPRGKFQTLKIRFKNGNNELSIR